MGVDKLMFKVSFELHDGRRKRLSGQVNSLQKYVGGSYKKSARSKILCDGRMGEGERERKRF